MIALLWCICPPFVSAQTAKKMGDDFNTAFIKAFCCGCIPCIGAGDRRKLRDKYNLPPEPCGDLMVHCCLGSCATCQEAREVNVRELEVKPMPMQNQVAVQPQMMMVAPQGTMAPQGQMMMVPQGQMMMVPQGQMMMVPQAHL
jgi:Cys-rich protein (TIGR01571 family)